MRCAKCGTYFLVGTLIVGLAIEGCQHEALLPGQTDAGQLHPESPGKPTVPGQLTRVIVNVTSSVMPTTNLSVLKSF